MKPPRISLRVNGARIGDPARPTDALDPLAAVAAPIAAPRLPMKRLVPRVNAALSTRPNDYMPDDDEAAS